MANEKRLIDANAIPYEEHYVPDGDVQWEYKKELCVCKSAIDQMPTVEAVEVVHGRWIIDKEHLIATCSECGKILRFSDEMQIAFLHDEERFCYYCGADMRGDGNG